MGIKVEQTQHGVPLEKQGQLHQLVAKQQNANTIYEQIQIR